MKWCLLMESGNKITMSFRFSLFRLFCMISFFAVCFAVASFIFRLYPDRIEYRTEGIIDSNNANITVLWVLSEEAEPTAGLIAFGLDRPKLWVSNRGVFRSGGSQIEVPFDGYLYILDPELCIHKTKVSISDLVKKVERERFLLDELAEESKRFSWGNAIKGENDLLQ